MKSMLAAVNGIKLAYSDSGPPEGGDGSPVVLLVHGFPLNRSMWDPQFGSLRAAGARVVAPDLRGFGASEGGPSGPLSMDQHADDLAALLDVLDIRNRVIYVGLSMGGYVGFALWRRHPRRVQAFVLMDTRATADAPEARQGRYALAVAVEQQNSPQPALDAMLPRLFSPRLRPGSAPEVLVRAMMSGSSTRGVADGARGLAERPDSVELLPSIDVPTLVMVGEHDQLTPPADSQQIARGIPGADLIMVEQAGHMANLENPESVNTALIAFVQRYSKNTSTV
jgi:pimeloyl-ACP methyl ester carboxylesterase